MAEQQRTYPVVFRKTFCGYALNTTITHFQDEDYTFSDELKEKFLVEFDKAFYEIFQEHINTSTHIKGSGSYRSTDGNFWEFMIKNPEIKCDSDFIQPKLLHIWAASGDEGTKNRKKTKGR